MALGSCSIWPLVASALNGSLKSGSSDFRPRTRTLKKSPVLIAITSKTKSVRGFKSSSIFTKSSKSLRTDFEIFQEITQSNLHKLEITRKLSKWVSHNLSAGNNLQWVQICLSFLSRNKKATLLNQILTCDKKESYMIIRSENIIF